LPILPYFGNKVRTPVKHGVGAYDLQTDHQRQYMGLHYRLTELNAHDAVACEIQISQKINSYILISRSHNRNCGTIFPLKSNATFMKSNYKLSICLQTTTKNIYCISYNHNHKNAAKPAANGHDRTRYEMVVVVVVTFFNHTFVNCKATCTLIW